MSLASIPFPRPERHDDAGDAGPWLLTEHEAATLLGVSDRTLFSIAKRGDIPVVRIGGSKRYDRRDLREYIERMKRRAG